MAPSRACMCECVYAHMNIILVTEVTFISCILFIIVGLQIGMTFASPNNDYKHV